ncbi:OsmC family protein [Hymenobacter sp. B81]|uniref:OsmC family protein n=1 Tax=Hymenobacter sp. B81 TaxID=3344878 RepID=UPI0037DCF364
MQLSARVSSRYQQHEVEVQTNGVAKTLTLVPKPEGYGSVVNGGELLLLALATCFCNDLYREAARRGLLLDGVEVEVTGEFGAAGEPGRNFRYRARVQSGAPAAAIDELIQHTDRVAEVHNTLRRGLEVVLQPATDEPA